MSHVTENINEYSEHLTFSKVDFSHSLLREKFKGVAV